MKNTDWQKYKENEEATLSECLADADLHLEKLPDGYVLKDFLDREVFFFSSKNLAKVFIAGMAYEAAQ